MKTTNDILSDVYKVIKSSPIDDLDGIIDDVRPTKSTKNDCVYNIISGNTQKFLQSAGLYVKIFSKDLFLNNTYIRDRVKIGEFETLLFNLSTDLLKMPGYSFDIQSREIYTEAVQDGVNKEHYSILKINLRNLL